MKRSDSENYVIKKFSELKKENIVSPDFQRLLNPFHVDIIRESLHKKLISKQSYIIPGCLIICISEDGTKWLVDGNHRYQAYDMIFEELKQDLNIMCNYISVNSNEEAYEIFEMVNQSIPVPKMPIGVTLSLPNLIFKEIDGRYPKLFSLKSGCHRPSVFRDSFIEKIGLLISSKSGITVEEFIV